MENLDFGAGFALITLGLIVIGLVGTILVEVLTLHFLSKFTLPYLVRFLNLQVDPAKAARIELATYLITWVILTPIVTGITGIFLRNAFYEIHQLGSFSFVNLYLFSLTLWYYNRSFEQLQLKPIKYLILQGLVFSLVAFAVNFLVFVAENILDLTHSVFFIFINPLAFGALTLYYIKKNQRNLEPPPEKTAASGG